VSDATIRLVLTELKRSGKIDNDGGRARIRVAPLVTAATGE